MHHKHNHVNPITKLVPFKLDQVLNHFRFEDFKLIAVCDCFNDLTVFFGHGGDNVQVIFDLINLSIWLILSSVDLLENSWVVVSELEVGLVEASHLSGNVVMSSGPLVEIEGPVEDIGFQKGSHLYFLLEHVYKVVLKQVGVNVVVLIFDDVSHHKVNRPNLVVLKSYINCRLSITLLKEYWEITAEVFLVPISQ